MIAQSTVYTDDLIWLLKVITWPVVGLRELTVILKIIKEDFPKFEIRQI